MTDALLQLIEGAIREATPRATPCGQHQWATEGGRSCPKGYNHCGQPVYRCGVCGAWDYGDRGGPAHVECWTDCRLPIRQGEDGEPVEEDCPVSETTNLAEVAS